jgi:hypothetical protein
MREELERKKGNERKSMTKGKPDTRRVWKSDRKRWKEEEKWGDEKWVRGTHNPNYHLDFEFHPTFGWNYFLSDYEYKKHQHDVDMTFFSKKKMYI